MVICCLRWDWEIPVPELQTSVFIVPDDFVKNGEERLIVLNKVAKSVVESVAEWNRNTQFFSNLLPEGSLRDYLAGRAGVSEKREFFLLWALGRDLPGGITILR